MSYQDAPQPACRQTDGAVELVIEPKKKDLGEMTVRRVLPARERRMVGPFIFFDHMGPAEFAAGEGIQVRPHPHIGIATITYLFEGEIMHRDSLGFAQPIRAGAVNLMTAGRGIVHSERAGSDLDIVSQLHGIQSWLALPDGSEDIEPGFAHTPAREIPGIEKDGVTTRVILGEFMGESSPVRTYSPTLYLEARMQAGSRLHIAENGFELGVYLIAGALDVGGRSIPAGSMAVAKADEAISLHAGNDAHIMIAGGAPIGKRHIWWNFVASSREQIEAAKTRWREGGFDRVPGDDEFIPLPD